jgi:type IV pilus assembly protein PilB
MQAQDASAFSASHTFEQFLQEHGRIQQPVFERLQAEKTKAGVGFSVDEWLISQKVLDEEAVAQARAEFFNLPYIDLRSRTIPAEAAALIPKESVNFYNLAPFAFKDNVLQVALMDPTNLQALQALEFVGQKQGVQVQLYIASRSSIDTMIGRKKNLTSVVGEALEDFKTQREKEVKVQARPVAQENIEGAPIIRIVDVILSNAIEANASDIHIEPSDVDVRVRYRIDGILHTSLMLPKHVHPAIISRLKILANLKIDESRLPQDGRFHVDVAGKSVDLRVSILPLIYGEKVVMRILDKSGKVPTLEDLGVRGKTLEWVMENIKKTHGIFLITGPTGSGKSTTLYAILSMINTMAVNIITLEDPVEYFIEGINQSQINPDIGLTFAAGLRSILRQDPNVIMVGEVRDKETAELAVHAALTGHLVFSTLHTNNAIGAMPRLMDMDIEPFLLTASVNLVVAQRLVRKICENCRKSLPVPEPIAEQLKAELVGVPDVYYEGIQKGVIQFYKGEGCEKCERTGYKGRLGIYEALSLVPEIQDLILAKQPSGKILEVANKLGMISMRQDGIIKVLRGETTLEEVVRVTKE